MVEFQIQFEEQKLASEAGFINLDKTNYNDMTTEWAKVDLGSRLKRQVVDQQW